MFKYFLFLLCISQLCYAQEEIVVHLNATTPLCKTFLSSSLDAALTKVLLYDLTNNGYCLPVQQKKDASLVITAKEEKNALVFEVQHEQRRFSSPPIALTHNINEDRKLIHQAHDALCKELFGRRGIASERILYTARSKLERDSSKWTSEVWIADYDGANTRQLTQENALVVTPTVLRGGKNPYFFYVSYKEGEPKIFLGSALKAKRVTYMVGNQFMPAISKQLDRIAFISTIHGKEDLFLQEFSLETGVRGKAIKLFSAPMATQGTPSFHPSGKEIAFVSNKDGTARIYVMRIPKSGERPQDCPLTLISKKNRDNTSPNWSPDGNKIAYSALTRGVRQIWIYDMKKREEIQLTFGDKHSENPVWASDSLHLMYNSASFENGELYMIDCNQKRPTKITLGPKDKRFPAWEGVL